MLRMICEILVGIYLIGMSMYDLKKRKIPIWPGVACLVIVVVLQIVSNGSHIGWACGMLIGVCLYGISKLTRGGVGEGDAFVYILTGASVGLVRNFELLLISMILCSIVAVYLYVFKKVGRRYEIPFVPFTVLAYGVVMIWS